MAKKQACYITPNETSPPKDYPYELGKYPYLESRWDEIRDSKLNPVLFFKAWCEIMGDRAGIEYTLNTIINKETGEIVYQADTDDRAG